MILAIDCDLRQSYAVADDGQTGRGANPLQALDRLAYRHGTTILFEIASPVSFNRGAAGHAAMTQLAKWAIWNAAWAGTLDMLLPDYMTSARLLVSPSNVWTRGYNLKTRHAMAGADAPKKDLRECQSMIWFYKQRPQDWVPLNEYLGAL